MRIAMWSGPRNLSTAMMYAFSARNDCSVIDEPFYAAYLNKTDLDHPMRAAILAAQSTQPEQVINGLTGPCTTPHFYQKHMTQHMISGISRNWMKDMKNVFLIRHPARVVASFAAKYEAPSLSDIGFTQQANLFNEVKSFGGNPIVIDSADIRRDPEMALKKLCEALGLEWQDAMLNWPKGGNRADGVWAAHWYGVVHNSTGFSAIPEGPLPDLTGIYSDLAQSALPYYTTLESMKIGL